MKQPILRLTTILTLALAVGGAIPNVVAQETNNDNRRTWENNPAIERSINKGLEYLVKKQAANGSFTNNGSYTMAMTSLSGLAFLSTGSTPERGPYSEQLAKALTFVIEQTRKASFKKNGHLTTPSEGQPMYGHGFGLLFLAQVYGTVSDPDLSREINTAIRKCVICTSRSQSKYGGWFYSPNSAMDEGSVTVTQLQALRAAQNCGIAVNETVIQRSIEYLRKSMNKDGGIRYRVSSPGGGSAALTSAGVACFYNCGIYTGEHVKRGLKFLNKQFFSQKNGAAILRTRGHFMYTHQYASQVYHYKGGADWKTYYSVMSNHLIKTQSKSGAWSASPGAAYSTPIGIMILSLPYRLLPINQR